MIEDVEQRFWAKVDRSGGENACWEWQGSRVLGYGQIMHEGKLYTTHRLAYLLTRGRIDKGLHVLHHCDNKACCNPKHLHLGTPKDNAREAALRKRHPRQQLSMTDAFRVLSRYAIDEVPRSQIAKEFGCSVTVVRNVTNGESFPDIYQTFVEQYGEVEPEP